MRCSCSLPRNPPRQKSEVVKPTPHAACLTLPTPYYNWKPAKTRRKSSGSRLVITSSFLVLYPTEYLPTHRSCSSNSPSGSPSHHNTKVPRGSLAGGHYDHHHGHPPLLPTYTGPFHVEPRKKRPPKNQPLPSLNSPRNIGLEAFPQTFQSITVSSFSISR